LKKATLGAAALTGELAGVLAARGGPRSMRH
jgi:hypothetical protein